MICPVVVCALHLGCLVGAAWLLTDTTKPRGARKCGQRTGAKAVSMQGNEGNRPNSNECTCEYRALQSPFLPLLILVSLIKNKQNALVKYSQ